MSIPASGSNSQHQGPVVIDVEKVMERRLGKKRMKHIPRFVVKWLERFICQDRLNELLCHNYPATGAEFCAGVIRDLRVKYDVKYPERLPGPGGDDSRVVFVSNHPLGGLDGMILIDMLSRHCCRSGESLHFIVNDLLTAVEPLHDVFVPVNKHGRQSRTAASMVEEAFDGQDPVVMFPAGLCSRRDKNGLIRDGEWNSMFVRRALKSGRDIIPLRFVGENSSFFYKFANLRKRLGIKFNYEMTRLPAEVINAEGKSFTVIVGERVTNAELASAASPAEAASRIRESIYSL